MASASANLKIVRTDAEEALSGRFDDVSAALPGGEPVAATRREALSMFAARGLPNRRVEEWKYSDLRARLKEAAPPADPEVPFTGDELAAALGPLSGVAAATAVFVNGAYRSELSDLGKVAEQINFASLADVLKAGDAPMEGAWARNYLMANEADRDAFGDALLALNTAYVSDGAVMWVDEDVEIAEPVHLVFVTAGDAPGFVSTRNHIMVCAGARLSLIESHVSAGSAPMQINAATFIGTGDRARVDHVKCLRSGADDTHVIQCHADLDQGAAYDACEMTIGSSFARNQSLVKFSGEDASVSFNGVALLRDQQHCDSTLQVDHAVPHGKSRELYKAVLDDKARGVFQGKVIVRPHAQKTDGEQMARAMLLSDEAEFYSKPELEIFADDVVCGHGSTSGQIDEDLLFYLRSRGIPEAQARGILINAFIGEAFDGIEREAVRAALMQLASGWTGAPLDGEDEAHA